MIEESKIRKRAYELWEKDGCPEGGEQFYWRLGQDQLKAEARHFDIFTANPISIVEASLATQAIPSVGA